MLIGHGRAKEQDLPLSGRPNPNITHHATHMAGISEQLFVVKKQTKQYQLTSRLSRDTGWI